MRKFLTSVCAVMLTAGMAWGQEEVADLYVRFNAVPEESGLKTGVQSSEVGAGVPINFDGGEPTDAYRMTTPIDGGDVYTLTLNLPAGDYEYQVVKADGTGSEGEKQAWTAGRPFAVSEGGQEVVFRAKVEDDGYVKFLCDAQVLLFSSYSDGKTRAQFPDLTGEDGGVVRLAITDPNYKGYTQGIIFPEDINSFVADVLPIGKGKYSFPGGANGKVRWLISYDRYNLEADSLVKLVTLLDTDLIGINGDAVAAENLPEQAGTFTAAQPLMLIGGTTSVSARIGVDEPAGAEKANDFLKIAPRTIEAKMHYNVYNADSTEMVAESNALLNTEADMATPEYETVWTLAEPLNVSSGLNEGDYTLNVWFETVCQGDTIRSAVHTTDFTVESGSPTTGFDVPALQANVTTQGQTICAAFDGTATVKLYALNGQLLDSRVVAGEYTYTASAGLYLLEVDGATYKVAVR